MMPSLVDEPPEGDQWQHEIKYDGYRTEIAINDGQARAFTRNGHDWSEKYRFLMTAAGHLRCSSALIDGEVIVQDELGRSDFHSLRSAMHHDPRRLVFMAFDLLELDGRDLRRRPLEDRRGHLQDLLGENRTDSCLQVSSHVTGNGAEFFAAVDDLGLEGIVSKKLGSRYRSGRSTSWLKVKTFEEAVFVVIGARPERGRPSLALLARGETGDLSYAGTAAITLAADDRQRFWTEIDKLIRQNPVIPMEERKAQWVEPELRVRARYLRNEPKLRHATVTGLLPSG